MSRASNNRSIKNDILKLRSQKKTYNEIADILQCSKSVISYHCGSGSEKARVKNLNKTTHPLCKKVSSFKNRHSTASYDTFKSKVKTFKRRVSRNYKVNNITENYSCKDVFAKLGENPICYLTGQKIDLSKPKSYNLDHIVAASKGGTNDLSNLGICVVEANSAKSNLSIDEFHKLCEKVLKWRDKCKSK
tara:strand:+ start:1605 stop:2174 length:570 start_codon:yes stop_codon:yes gene_type:complete